MELAQVIKLKEGTVYIKDYIDFYISKKLSDNTKSAYIVDIQQFFKYCFNTELEFITLDMLQGLSSQKAQSFFIEMNNEKKYTQVTIARKLNSIKALLNDMTNDIIDGCGEPYLKYNPLATFKFSVKNKSSYGYFTHNEMLSIIKFAYEENIELGLYFSLLYKTGIRAEAMRTITTKNLYIKDNSYRIKVIDKGSKEADCEIGETLYNECLECADINNQIFHFSVNYALNKLCCKTTYKANGKIKTNFKNSLAYKIGLTEEECSKEQRYLTLHSIKKASVTTVLNNSNSMIEASKQGHHTSFQYLSVYTESNQLNNSSRYINLDNNNTDKTLQDRLQAMSKEDIINIIMNMDERTKNKILNM